MGYITDRLITDLVEEKIAGSELFIGEVKVKPGNIIYVFMDGDHGVTIEQCVNISRHIEHSLDRAREDFELHVSSYGIGQPLKCVRQYKNAVGKQLSATTNENDKYTGQLITADEHGIVLEIPAAKKKDAPIKKEIPMSDIKTAKIEVVFK